MEYVDLLTNSFLPTTIHAGNENDAITGTWGNISRLGVGANFEILRFFCMIVALH